MIKTEAARDRAATDVLFNRIGSFLAEHRLPADPDTYRFVHLVLNDPAGPIAEAVAHLVDGGFRLQPQDIERLDGRPAERTHRSARPALQQITDEVLIAEAQNYIRAFAETVRTMHDATTGFERDLTRGTAAIRRDPSIARIEDIAHITGAMIEQLRATERELEATTAEVEVLRQKLDEAQNSARRDPLTGLGNRLAFDEAFTSCRAGDGDCCLALCDIDRFKRINDEHGHGVGDRVLGAIGQELALQCAGHLVTRHGGEEFAILFSGVSLAEAEALLENARVVISAKRFRSRETDRPIGSVTISAGVTAVAPDEAADDTFARADQLLYRAKSEGRDRIRAA